MQGISAIIITLNEEKNIKRCIASLAEIADEIIVVDSFSTDKTEEICKAENVTFVPHKWEGYTATKNFANSLANHNYILSVDADEAFSEELMESILAVKKSGLNGAYSFNRLTNYCGSWIKHCGWYPDVKMRLFQKSVATWKGEFVHEELYLNPEVEVKHLAGDLLHYSYYSTQEHYDRIEKYTDLDAKTLKARGKTGGKFRGLLSAASRFFNMYLVKQGFLDGTAGWQVCRLSAYAAYLKYKKLG